MNYWVGAAIGPRAFQREHPVPQEGVSRPHPRVLREARRQDDHPGAVRSDHPHLRAVRGRGRGDELRAGSSPTTWSGRCCGSGCSCWRATSSATSRSVTRELHARDPGDHRASRSCPSWSRRSRGGAGRHDPAVRRGRAGAGSGVPLVRRPARARARPRRVRAEPGRRAGRGGGRPGATRRRSRGSRSCSGPGPAHARVDDVERQDQADDPQIPTRSFDIR